MLYSSCKKDNTTPGKFVEGTISLEVHVVHHSWDVSGIMIYLEKNATDFPGRDSSVYDYKGQADGYGKYTFEHLYPGKYYVYASGYDAVFGANVIGYNPVVLEGDIPNNQASITLIASE